MSSIQKLGTSALLAAASAFAFTTWYGDSGNFVVDTGFGAENEYVGYWFTYGDDADGGKSTITWPVAMNYDDYTFDAVIDYCQGVCGTFKFSKGALTYNPFVGIGFNIAGEDESGSLVAADATDMGGVCMAYSVDADAALEMGLGDAVESGLGYDRPYVSLPKSATGAVKEFTWEDFKQYPLGTQMITGEEAAKQLVSIRFKIQGADGTTGSFNIMSVGAYGGDCKVTATSDAIGAKAAQATLDAQLSGRTLSFGKTVAKAEIINLQGQVVMAASSVKTMDLSKVQAGVYMVRAGGISKRIMLR